MELITRAESHRDRVAIQDGNISTTYDELLQRSASMAATLLDGAEGLNAGRVAFLIPAGVDYISAQWGIWRAGGVAVPLSLSATESELEYTLSDSESHCVIATDEIADKIQPLCERLGLRVVNVNQIGSGLSRKLPVIEPEQRAMILYTSGTTSKPKGVVTTHANIQSQIETLVDAWRWRSDDRIPLFLPLHHIHGIINVMSCSLWSGATIEPFPRFQKDAILHRVAAGAYSIFMAVPTIYVQLIQHLQSLARNDLEPIVSGFKNMRLMISGSAALPASVHEAWTGLTGQMLLERYGMTEIGMALSNPYDGERRSGAVGQPLPGVEIRLKQESGEITTADDQPGEIQVKGASVFLEYWNRAEATRASFEDGWFKTGDMAVLQSGYYRIMGRQSVDIIKSGGYKLSALEIEAVLLDHPDISECAVVGIEDATWGEAVAAAVVLTGESTLDIDRLRDWCGDRMSRYKLPKHLLIVDQLPRNAMGKVTKPAVRGLF